MKFFNFFKRRFKKRRSGESILKEIDTSFPERSELVKELQKNVSYLLTNLCILEDMEDSVRRRPGENSDDLGDKRLLELSKSLQMPENQKQKAYNNI